LLKKVLQLPADYVLELLKGDLPGTAFFVDALNQLRGSHWRRYDSIAKELDGPDLQDFAESPKIGGRVTGGKLVIIGLDVPNA